MPTKPEVEKRLFMSPRELAQYKARKAAKNDKAQGLAADPGRHNAIPGSAWADWYRQAYESVE